MGTDFPSDPCEFSLSIVHFYTRLLVLRCYEDYTLRHDPQPINLDKTDRVCFKDHPYIIAMHQQRLKLVELKQDLFAFLGPPSLIHKPAPVHQDSGSVDGPYRRKLRDLVTDLEMLSSLYDNAMRIYDWYIHEVNSDYKTELASEQLEEAKESKATAISFGKLSNLAFLYLPLNFVCALLGMNLAIFGQGQVPVWVFLALVVFFGLLTYLPIYLPSIDQRRFRLGKLTYCLTQRSVPAGFWFLAFCLTHDQRQNFEIAYSGLVQVLLGYTDRRTKGWTMDGRDDGLFAKATWGSQAFWKEKVKMIIGAVEELKASSEATELTV